MIRINFLVFHISLFLLGYLYKVDFSNAHGYLADPPARSSAWLFDKEFAKCCLYYNHNQMFCGGTHRQWVINGGKCSICGEPFDAESFSFARGGSKYLGKIVLSYRSGSIMPVRVVLTANHLGRFQFRICNLDQSPEQDATQECLDENVLKLENHQSEYIVNRDEKVIDMNIRLPEGFTCKHCVFQWKYVTGNSWGSFAGKECVGCGRENEEFYGCSDISVIEAQQSSNSESTERPPTKPCKTRPKSSSLVMVEKYCRATCKNDCRSENSVDKDCLENCVEICLCK